MRITMRNERNDKTTKRRKIRKQIWFIPAAVIMILAAAFLIYAGRYYHAGTVAQSMLKSDETVSVTQTDYGWLFDGLNKCLSLVQMD